VDPEVSKRLFDEEVGAMRGMGRFNGGGFEVVSATYPDLVVRLPHPKGSRRFRFRCNEWDEQPPSVKPVDDAGNELAGEPSGGLFMGLNPGWGLCAPGTREYHGHHTENPWSAHRDSTRLVDIVVRVAFHYRNCTV
jgi:hypothetical protein